MRLTELATIARRWCEPQGVEVIEVAGWQTRGAHFSSRPDGAVRHWTAGAPTGTFPSYRVLVDGRAGLPGPLCQLAQDRADRVYVIAAGKANHAGHGEWNKIGPGGNSLVVGLEIEWSGPSESFSPRRRFVSELAMRALLDCCAGTNPRDACEHREWALPRGRKIDTNLDGEQLRRRMAELAAGPEPEPPPEEEDMPPYMVSNPTKGLWLVDNDSMWMRPITPAQGDGFAFFGIKRTDVDDGWFDNPPIIAGGDLEP